MSFNLTNSLLPVTLLNFDGRVVSKNISLNWKVSSEINTDYYLVEKSADGALFNTLGKVSANGTAGPGTDINYGYTDLSPLNGINCYRLRMVDKDGKYSY